MLYIPRIPDFDIPRTIDRKATHEGELAAEQMIATKGIHRGFEILRTVGSEQCLHFATTSEQQLNTALSYWRAYRGVLMQQAAKKETPLSPDPIEEYWRRVDAGGEQIDLPNTRKEQTK